MHEHLLGIDREVGHLEDEVGPDDVEDKEDGEEAVEDVVGGEHVDVGLRGVDGGVQDTGREKVAPLQHFEMMSL